MDRHAVTGNDENYQSQHELLEEIAQLEQRERVQIGENDDLRRQLVEMKKEEKKKFDDLMVEHRQLKGNADRSQRAENGGKLVVIVPNDIHIKQELLEDQSDNGQQQMDYDDPDTNSHNVTLNIKTEPMDCDLVVVKEEIKEEYDEDTSTNQVTVKTESIDEDVKVEIKEEDDEDTSTNQVTVKTESIDEDVKVEIKEEDDEDTSTNTNQVTVKTESIDENVKVEIKEEIKEEDDHEDDCDGCVRCLVKKEEVSDDGEVDHDEGELIRGDEHDYEVDQLSSNQPIESNEVINQENGLGDEDEDKSDLGEDDEMPNTTNDNHDRPMVVSNEASSSARARSNRVTSKQSTGSTVHNVNKRKQTRTNRTGKRSKKTVEVGDDYNGDDGDDGDEDIASDDQIDDKYKVIHFDCTESNCEVKLTSLDQLHSHLLTSHRILPHRCFAQNCNSRCDNRKQMSVHIKQHHSNATHYVCHVCGNEFTSQIETCRHWRQNHLTGQFECNLNGCSQMSATRMKVHRHQHYKHCPESKRFECAHDGCSSSFVTKKDLKRHELTHLNTRPFHCTWLQCSHSANVRSNLIKHIRMQHFGLPKSLKEQMAKKIEDVRDPNEYVRVVVEGDEQN